MDVTFRYPRVILGTIALSVPNTPRRLRSRLQPRLSQASPHLRPTIAPDPPVTPVQTRCHHPHHHPHHHFTVTRNEVWHIQQLENRRLTRDRHGASLASRAVPRHSSPVSIFVPPTLPEDDNDRHALGTRAALDWVPMCETRGDSSLDPARLRPDAGCAGWGAFRRIQTTSHVVPTAADHRGRPAIARSCWVSASWGRVEWATVGSPLCGRLRRRRGWRSARSNSWSRD